MATNDNSSILGQTLRFKFNDGPMAGKTVENIEALEILTYDGLRMWVGPTPEAEIRSSKHCFSRAVRNPYNEN